MPTQASHSKVQRWTDLIAALLARRLGASFAELEHDVPAYGRAVAETSKESAKRTFERDKDELRQFGIPIETIPDAENGENTRYRLRSTDFYLPYLSLDDGSPRRRPSHPTVTLTPDDLELIARAVARLTQLGDPVLAEDARAAANKLAFDLPLADAPGDVRLLDGDDGADPKLFALLGDALRARKVVSFTYHKPADDSRTRREVEPYGLFFVHAHWYLAGRDRSRDGIRNFRLSRFSDASANRKKPGTRDYEIPDSFRLRDHARGRDAWELGDAESVTAEVMFMGTSGAVAAAMRLGEEAGDQRRRYTVRRMDSFARWLISFGGDARPVSPPELVELYRRALEDTLARYRVDPSLRSG